MSKQDDSSFGVAVFAVLVACFALGVSLCAIAFQAKQQKPCKCKPAPTPAPCCKADECKQELALVDARFGDVWDELVEVQEQLAKVKPCDCGPVKECCCEPSKPCQCDPAKACACDGDKNDCTCKPDNHECVCHLFGKKCECEPNTFVAPVVIVAESEPKPPAKAAVNSQLPVRRVFKRCK